MVTRQEHVDNTLFLEPKGKSWSIELARLEGNGKCGRRSGCLATVRLLTVSVDGQHRRTALYFWFQYRGKGAEEVRWEGRGGRGEDESRLQPRQSLGRCSCPNSTRLIPTSPALLVLRVAGENDQEAHKHRDEVQQQIERMRHKVLSPSGGSVLDNHLGVEHNVAHEH